MTLSGGEQFIYLSASSRTTNLAAGIVAPTSNFICFHILKSTVLMTSITKTPTKKSLIVTWANNPAHICTETERRVYDNKMAARRPPGRPGFIVRWIRNTLLGVSGTIGGCLH